MTRERREEVVALALAVSLVAHVGIMFYARPRVMTHVARGFSRVVNREPMRVVTDRVPESVLTEAAAELQAVKDAPPARDADELSSPKLDAAARRLAPVEASIDAPAPSEPDAAPVSFDAVPPDFGPKPVSAAIPVVPISPPAPVSAAAPVPPRIDSAPKSAVSSPAAALPAGGTDPESLFAPSVLLRPRIAEKKEASDPEKTRDEESASDGEFKPADEVYDKVDEKVVKREREAVKKLLDAGDAVELERFADAQAVAAGDGAWTYFKVMLSARSSLPVVPKDVVLLIDSSGSIGRDRMASLRSAAKRLLPEITNSGDRFNLVAFRDRYQYAFRRWQECSRTSFERAEDWIDDLAAHGRTDVFATIRSVLTLPRDPARPLVALVVTDGEANAGVSRTAEIISRFTALNDGLISLYMYGVKAEANRELMNVLTRGNRGEYFIYSGWKRRSGSGMAGLAERFRDPVLSDIRVVFSATTRAESYPRRLSNLYKGGTLVFYGRVPKGERKVAFSLRGLNGERSYEGFFSFDLASLPVDSTAVTGWRDEHAVDLRLK